MHVEFFATCQNILRQIDGWRSGARWRLQPLAVYVIYGESARPVCMLRVAAMLAPCIDDLL